MTHNNRRSQQRGKSNFTKHISAGFVIEAPRRFLVTVNIVNAGRRFVTNSSSCSQKLESRAGTDISAQTEDILLVHSEFDRATRALGPSGRLRRGCELRKLTVENQQ